MGSDHDHTPAGTSRGRLTAVLSVTLAVLIAEVIGAVLTGSLALIADAGHLATDVAGVAIALTAATLAGRPATERRTFGNHRMEVLAAIANAVLLFGVGGYVLIEATLRLADPPNVASSGLIVFGLIGLAGNLSSLWILYPVRSSGLNVRGAFLEVLGDALGSAAVVVAALVIAVTGWQRADTVASLLIAVLILPRTWRLFRESCDVLLEAAPRDLDLTAVRRHILALDGVLAVHDVHAWLITSGMPALSAHVVIEESDRVSHGQILDRLCVCLRDDFGIEHSTFQLEADSHAGHEAATHD